jgi:hypothetical protein
LKKTKVKPGETRRQSEKWSGDTGRDGEPDGRKLLHNLVLKGGTQRVQTKDADDNPERFNMSGRAGPEGFFKTYDSISRSVRKSDG